VLRTLKNVGLWQLADVPTHLTHVRYRRLLRYNWHTRLGVLDRGEAGRIEIFWSGIAEECRHSSDYWNWSRYAR